jgi:hypothetical protein
MGNQGYRANYLAAFEGANHHLESIYSEYHELQHRKEKLESAISALEPFLQSASSFSQEIHTPEPRQHEPEPTYSQPAYSELYSAPQPIAEPVMRAERFAEPERYAEPEPFAQPIAPAVFAAAETELDPLQLRINRALGLAVA